MIYKGYNYIHINEYNGKAAGVFKINRERGKKIDYRNLR